MSRNTGIAWSITGQVCDLPRMETRCTTDARTEDRRPRTSHE